MDIAAASAPAAPWIVVGVLLAVAAILLVALVAAPVVRRRGASLTGAPVPGPVDDDLPGFLESPPGSSAVPGPAAGRHVPLAPPPQPPPPTPARRAPAVQGPVAGLALLLLVVAGGVALTALDPSPSRDGRAEHRSVVADRRPPAEVRMRFAGLVLEERAVGVTATYPEIELTADDDGPVARLTLPTWNCLSAEAPEHPEEAGCVPSQTQYAELRPPRLDLTRDGSALRFGGEFPTSTRPSGSAPETTGRVYRVEVTVTPDEQLRPGRWSPADGVFTLDGREAESLEGELRRGD